MGTTDARSAGENRFVVDVIEAIARETGEDPTEISPPLASVIDPEALERGLARSSGMTRVFFDYRGREVEVRADGTVEIHESANES